MPRGAASITAIGLSVLSCMLSHDLHICVHAANPALCVEAHQPDSFKLHAGPDDCWPCYEAEAVNMTCRACKPGWQTPRPAAKRRATAALCLDGQACRKVCSRAFRICRLPVPLWPATRRLPVTATGQLPAQLLRLLVKQRCGLCSCGLRASILPHVRYSAGCVVDAHHLPECSNMCHGPPWVQLTQGALTTEFAASQSMVPMSCVVVGVQACSLRQIRTRSSASPRYNGALTYLAAQHGWDLHWPAALAFLPASYRPASSSQVGMSICRLHRAAGQGSVHDIQLSTVEVRCTDTVHLCQAASLLDLHRHASACKLEHQPTAAGRSGPAR